MDFAGSFLILLGGLFFLSSIVTPLAHVLNVPRVTLLLLSGVMLGPYGLNLINGLESAFFPFITDVTLLIIGYLLGARLTPSYIEQYAKGVLFASVIITVITSSFVTLVLLLFGVDLKVAIILGAIAAATDPVAMLDVLKERAIKTRFGDLLEGIVAMDDVLGLLVFSVALALLGIVNGGGDVLTPITHMLIEVFGSVFLGALAGYLSAKILDTKKSGENVIVESLAFILLMGGGAIYFELSFLLAAMVMGAVVVNVADDSADHLHEIEYIEQPFLVLFFIIAGSSLNLSASDEVIWVLMIFVVARVFGRIAGAQLIPDKSLTISYKPGLGLALLPQAGVAMGMALLAANTYPELADIILPVAISATVVFEVFGPLATSRVLGKVERIELDA